jgi:hypothetical protein
MSRSYRKPYAAITGVRSAADDKRIARRSWRHAQNHAVRSAIATEADWDEFLMPARYETSFNNVYSWGRDGKQWLHFEPRWSKYEYWFRNWLDDEEADRARVESYNTAIEWFKHLHRK